MQEIFASENIRFVRVTEELVEDYLAMVNDIERVGRLIGRRTEPVSREKELRWVRGKLAEGAPIFSMIEKAGGAFIGNIELTDLREREAELGIAITASQQDRGFGTEAIRALVAYGTERMGLDRIWLKVYPDNARAIRVYEKCGFREYDRDETDVFMEVLRPQGRT